MPKFTKKPVEIEARQFDGTQDSARAMCEWMAEHGCEALRAFCGHDEPYQVYISTLEGRMTASAGDWIIKGVKGEFYPCKPDTFELTYQPAALSHAAGQEDWEENCKSAESALELMTDAFNAVSGEMELLKAAGQEVVAGEFSDWFATWAAHKGLTMHKTADGRYLCPNTSLAEDAHSAGCMTAAIYYMELCRQDELNSPAVARSEGEEP